MVAFLKTNIKEVSFLIIVGEKWSKRYRTIHYNIITINKNADTKKNPTECAPKF